MTNSTTYCLRLYHSETLHDQNEILGGQKLQIQPVLSLKYLLHETRLLTVKGYGSYTVHTRELIINLDTIIITINLPNWQSFIFTCLARKHMCVFAVFSFMVKILMD